jgi:hypothetical protein
MMRSHLQLASLIISAFMLSSAAPGAQACDPDGNVQFVCGLLNPEDLLPVPQSTAIVVAGMQAPGKIFLVNTTDRTSTVIFPSATAKRRPDTKTYNACPGPLASFEEFRPHGLSLRPGKGGLHTLYVVHHGSRESVEVFELDARNKTLTWVGCAVAPDSVGLNSVVALPEGAFAVTNFQRRGDPTVRDVLISGGNTGELWEWYPRTGWKMVPGSELPGPNGLEISKDGKWFYVGVWGRESVMRLSRGQTPIKQDSVRVGFHVDNVRWAPDGSLLAAGQAGPAQAVLRDCLGPGKQCSQVATAVARIDPNTLKAQELVRYRSNNAFVFGTAAIQVGKELWVGGVGGSGRIARFPIP